MCHFFQGVEFQCLVRTEILRYHDNCDALIMRFSQNSVIGEFPRRNLKLTGRAGDATENREYSGETGRLDRLIGIKTVLQPT